MSVVFDLSYLLLWLVVLIQSVVIIELLRQIGIFRLRLGDEAGALIEPATLERGRPAPPFSLSDPRAGQPVTQQALKGQRSLVVFMSPSCSPCRSLAADLPRFARYYPEIRLLGFCSGPGDSCLSFIDEFKFPFPVLIDDRQEVSQAYGANRTPHALLFDEDARVLIQGVPANWKQLEHLVAEEGTVMGSREWLITQEPDASTPTTGTVAKVPN